MKKNIKRVVITEVNSEKGYVVSRQNIEVENFDGLYYKVKETFNLYGGRTFVYDYTNDCRPKIQLENLHSEKLCEGVYINVKFI